MNKDLLAIYRGVRKESSLNNSLDENFSSNFTYENEEKQKKLFVHKDLANMTYKLFLPSPLTEKDKKGKDEIEIEDEKKGIIGYNTMAYKKGEVEYHIPIGDYQTIFANKAPKMAVSQDKNIKTLLILAGMKRYKNEELGAFNNGDIDDDSLLEFDFTFEDYAKLRGYSKKKIKRGGKFIDELKKDLYSGSYTIYRTDMVIDGKSYKGLGLPNLYSLFEPEDDNSWRVSFNHFYKNFILSILKGNAEQFYIYSQKEISDRTTTNKPYLHRFYLTLVQLKTEKATFPIKIGKFLEKMEISERYLKREPKRCFEILKECITYFSENYPAELNKIALFKRGAEERKERIAPQTLKNINYEAFKDILKKLEIKDIREAGIFFYHD